MVMQLPYSRLWFSVFGPKIIMALVLTNLFPLLGILFSILKKKAYKQDIRSNKVYIPELKYAKLTSSILIVFTFVFALPILVFYAIFSIFFIYFFDKLLLTYWYQPKELKTLLLNREFIFRLRWATPILMIIVVPYIII